MRFQCDKRVKYINCIILYKQWMTALCLSGTKKGWRFRVRLPDKNICDLIIVGASVRQRTQRIFSNISFFFAFISWLIFSSPASWKVLETDALTRDTLSAYHDHSVSLLVLVKYRKYFKQFCWERVFRSGKQQAVSNMDQDDDVHSGSAFKSLCGDDPFWDGNLTWHTDFPEFSTCFRKTVLIWGPCSVFWLVLPFHLRYYFHEKNAALSFSKLCLVRFW